MSLCIDFNIFLFYAYFYHCFVIATTGLLTHLETSPHLFSSRCFVAFFFPLFLLFPILASDRLPSVTVRSCNARCLLRGVFPKLSVVP